MNLSAQEVQSRLASLIRDELGEKYAPNIWVYVCVSSRAFVTHEQLTEYRVDCMVDDRHYASSDSTGESVLETFAKTHIEPIKAEFGMSAFDPIAMGV